MNIIIMLLPAAIAVAAGQAPVSAEDGIRQADEAWAKAVGAKSVEQALAFYDPEILTAGSAMPPANGIAEIRAMWTKYFSDPDFALSWKLDKAVVTGSPTIGYSSGTWRAGGQAGPYLAVWRKQRDSTWKVLIDAAWTQGNGQTAAAQSLPQTGAAAAILQADGACVKAMAGKSLEAEIACYEVAGVTAGNAMPPANGIAEIRAMLIKYFAEPNFMLTWKAENVALGASGAIGYTSGTWRNGGETGPYLAVWRKQSDGKWKLLIDSGWSLVPANQRESADVEIITQLENDSVKADLEDNASFYESLLADDWTKGTYTGKWRTKATYLARKKDPEYKTLRERLSDLKVRVSGDVAVATYTLGYEDLDHGQHIVRNMIYTDVFQKRNGAWKLIATHVSRVDQ